MQQLRLVRSGRVPATAPVYSNAASIYPLIADLAHLDREHSIALHLDSRQRVIARELVAVGELNIVYATCGAILKAALLNNSAAIVFAHNHPSGDSAPSGTDIEMTWRLDKAAALLGIKLLDHLVIGDSSYHSLKEMGLFGVSFGEFRAAAEQGVA